MASVGQNSSGLNTAGEDVSVKEGEAGERRMREAMCGASIGIF